MPVFTAGYIAALLAASTVVLFFLKLFEVIEWSWLSVVTPLFAGFIVFYATSVCVSFIKVKRKRARMIANGTYKRHPLAEKLAAILKIKLEEREAQTK